MKRAAHLQFPRNSCRRFDSGIAAQGANPETGDSGGKAMGTMPPFRRTGKKAFMRRKPAKTLLRVCSAKMPFARVKTFRERREDNANGASSEKNLRLPAG